jgi:hypothetical protein
MMDQQEMLREVWYYYQEHRSQYWDMMCDIEDRLAVLATGRETIVVTSIDVNQQLNREYSAGKRSKYAYGELPANWTELTGLYA